jgi:hypothetical protein
VEAAKTQGIKVKIRAIKCYFIEQFLAKTHKSNIKTRQIKVLKYKSGQLSATLLHSF